MKSYVGIEWSEENHDVQVHNEPGEVGVRFEAKPTAAGLRKLHKRLEKVTSSPGETLVAIETRHNIVVDSLWAKGYPVYVLAPSQVKASRPRQRNSAARNDDSDAGLLAKMVRLDRAHLTPWHPPSAPIRQLRSKRKLVDDITTAIPRQGNRLQAMGLRYYPAAARALTSQKFSAFCRAHGHMRTNSHPACYSHLPQPFPQADPTIVEAYQAQVPWMAEQLLALIQTKKALLKEIQARFQTHPHYTIFDSVPGAGQMLAPKLLVILGDRRERWPSPDDRRALTGTCPVTIERGKSRSVPFRRACNRAWRHTFQQLARCSISESPWAATYFGNALQRGLSENHAYRALANRWVGILWTLWTREVLHDEDIHLRNVNIHRRPQAA